MKGLKEREMCFTSSLPTGFDTHSDVVVNHTAFYFVS